jgi:hypothetical protein
MDVIPCPIKFKLETSYNHTMKIFPPQKTSAQASKTSTKAAKARGPAKKEAAELPVKKNLSADQIKEKLAAHVETSGASKNMAVKSSKKLGEGFLNSEVRPVVVPVAQPATKDQAVEVADVSEVKTPNTKDFVLNSDIATNDPTDTNTQEKLKTILAKGAFNFNAREKEALEKILGN